MSHHHVTEVAVSPRSTGGVRPSFVLPNAAPRGGHHFDRRDGSSSNAGGGAAAAVTTSTTVVDRLPIDAMDVEVLERYVMRVLTSLHRLVGKVSVDMELGAAAACSWRLARHYDDSTIRFLWTLTRRITKRIEKLGAMHEILLQKQESLSNAVRRRELRGDRGKEFQAQQSDLFLVEALFTKVVVSIDSFKSVETDIIYRLCHLHR